LTNSFSISSAAFFPEVDERESEEEDGDDEVVEVIAGLEADLVRGAANTVSLRQSLLSVRKVVNRLTIEGENVANFAIYSFVNWNNLRGDLLIDSISHSKACHLKVTFGQCCFQ